LKNDLPSYNQFAAQQLPAHGMRRYTLIGTGLPSVLLLIFLISGCSLFSTRQPDEPITDSGTFSQPDTPEQVVENIQSAISELNTLNYRRSLADGMIFRPTASAQARESVFLNWSRPQEEQYFSTMAAAAGSGTGHNLALNDRSFAIISDSKYVLDATYVLTLNHSRPDADKQVQGRLQWVIDQGQDGLWSLTEWTDQELGLSGSWSDLKAVFIE
jgi:hypothetical protein